VASNDNPSVSLRGVAAPRRRRRIPEVQKALEEARQALEASRALSNVGAPTEASDIEYRGVKGLRPESRLAWNEAEPDEYFDADATLTAIRAARAGIRADFETARRQRAS
jgi:hypothetical protein